MTLPPGGLPPQSALHTGRAVFTDAYAVLPRATMSDITASLLPGWDKTRAWILARPLSGFAETFAQYLMELEPHGGTQSGEPDSGAEGVLYVMAGEITLEWDDDIAHVLRGGGFAYLPPGLPWRVRNDGHGPARFMWIRKRWQAAPGLTPPDPIVTSEAAHKPLEMPDTEGRWATTRFVDPTDMRHDMHVNVVTFQRGGLIPFEETHVMEHGLFVLDGKAVYKLNTDWVEVEEGDFMWLRAFCPQACYAGGPGPFRYLLYKDVNRHPRLGPVVP